MQQGYDNQVHRGLYYHHLNHGNDGSPGSAVSKSSNSVAPPPPTNNGGAWSVPVSACPYYYRGGISATPPSPLSFNARNMSAPPAAAAAASAGPSADDCGAGVFPMQQQNYDEYPGLVMAHYHHHQLLLQREQQQQKQQLQASRLLRERLIMAESPHGAEVPWRAAVPSADTRITLASPGVVVEVQSPTTLVDRDDEEEEQEDEPSQPHNNTTPADDAGLNTAAAAVPPWRVKRGNACGVRIVDRASLHPSSSPIAPSLSTAGRRTITLTTKARRTLSDPPAPPKSSPPRQPLCQHPNAAELHPPKSSPPRQPLCQHPNAAELLPPKSTPPRQPLCQPQQHSNVAELHPPKSSPPRQPLCQPQQHSNVAEAVPSRRSVTRETFPPPPRHQGGGCVLWQTGGGGVFVPNHCGGGGLNWPLRSSPGCPPWSWGEGPTLYQTR
jgi:hypothetical protein